MLRATAAILVLAALLAGCGGETPPQAAPPVTPAPAVAPRPASIEPAPSAGAVAVRVNGEPIPLEAVTNLLLANGGLDIAHQLIASAVVDQAARAKGITVLDADIAAEHASALEQLGPNLTPEQQQRALAELMRQQGVSQRLWNLIMRRNALLRKLADDRLQITEAMVQEEFNRRYGGKVQVRHIQVNSLADAQQVADLLAHGADFAELARKVSTNAASAAEGGLIAPFARETPDVPKAIRNAAFALQAGQLSDIVQDDRYFHILKHERTVPPENVVFDEVREPLRAQLRQSTLRRLQVAVLQELIQTADVQFVNPILKEQARTQTPGPMTP